MNRSRLELKVGIFVLICLGLLAALLLQFSKGVTFFRKTYTVILNTANVGGLRPRAGVLMSGVNVGFVSAAQLSPQGTNVAVYLKIFSNYTIRDDAVFRIEQSGFLGDQFVAIYPGLNRGRKLEDGAEVRAEEPFNVQETARKLNEVIDTVQRNVLNEKTLTNLSAALIKLRSVADRAELAVDNVNALITSNTGPASAAFSNLVVFSDQLNAVGAKADGIIATNSPKIDATFSNLQTATIMLTNMLAEVNQGKGPVGMLLKDQALANNLKQMSGSFSVTASNLAVTSSNLNRLGLWHFLWYHPKQSEPPRTGVPPVQNR